MGFPILSIITFTPLIGAVLILLIPKDKENLIRRLAVVVSFIPLILAFVLYAILQRDPRSQRRGPYCGWRG